MSPPSGCVQEQDAEVKRLSRKVSRYQSLDPDGKVEGHTKLEERCTMLESDVEHKRARIESLERDTLSLQQDKTGLEKRLQEASDKQKEAEYGFCSGPAGPCCWQRPLPPACEPVLSGRRRPARSLESGGPHASSLCSCGAEVLYLSPAWRMVTFLPGALNKARLSPFCISI